MNPAEVVVHEMKRNRMREISTFLENAVERSFKIQNDPLPKGCSYVG